MQKVALYRKYRPESFDGVIGQEHVTRVLRNAVLENKISHAYIFSGPRGTGKTTMARILAKTINCTKRKDYNPCAKCPICIGIDEGRILDLIEIDAASNRGIDEIRDLREKVKFSPAEGEYKVFIIDEVHMLTKEAFNALLKTLEEPPAHAIFILATTELNKVPATILSRCQRHDFRRIRIADIVGRLEYIKEKEKIDISPDALKAIAEASDGGLRDAISLLDQLGSIGLKKISEDDVETVLGLAPHKTVYNFITNLLNNESGKALEIVEKGAQEGIDLTILAKSALEFLRKLLIVKISGEGIVEGTKEQVEEMSLLAKSVEKEKIISLIDEFFIAQTSFKANIDPTAVLTVLCAKEYKSSTENTEKPSEAQEVITAKKDAKPMSINGKWQHVLMEVKTKNNTLHAVLRVSNPSFEGDVLVLTFPYKFHKERIEEKKNKMLVEEIVKKIYSNPNIEIRCNMESNGHGNHAVSDAADAASILGGKIVD